MENTNDRRFILGSSRLGYKKFQEEMAWYKENIRLMNITFRSREQTLIVLREKIVKLKEKINAIKDDILYIKKFKKEAEEEYKELLSNDKLDNELLIPQYILLKDEVAKLKEKVTKAKQTDIELKQRENIESGKTKKKWIPLTLEQRQQKDREEDAEEQRLIKNLRK